MIQDEIARVKKLPRKHRNWVYDPRPEGALYLDDPVTQVANVGPTVARKLKASGITTIGDLIGLDDRDMKIVADRTPGLSFGQLSQYAWNCCDKLFDGDAPEVVYYLDAENPYAARFGTTKDDVWCEEEWRRHMKKNISAFSGVVCITELVKHIVIETKKFYSGTAFASTYHFYHDALKQLTSASCVDWMRTTKVPGEETCIHERWIYPEFGLNDVIGACWSGRPVGNSPELMPLDNSLNQDIHESVRQHTSMSLVIRAVNNSDPRLFSMATPKSTSSAYRRVFDPDVGVSPRPERIVQDINKVRHALKEIYNHKGVYVPGLAGSTRGHRNTAGATAKNNNHGGIRIRKEYNPLIPDSELHHDLRAALDDNGGNITSFFGIDDDADAVDYTSDDCDEDVDIEDDDKENEEDENLNSSSK